MTFYNGNIWRNKCSLTFGLLFLLLVFVHVHDENVYHVPQLRDKTYFEYFHCKHTEKLFKKRLMYLYTFSAKNCGVLLLQ